MPIKGLITIPSQVYIPAPPDISEKISNFPFKNVGDFTSNPINPWVKMTTYVDFKEGLSKTIDWYLENLEWLEHIKSGAYISYYENKYGINLS